MTRRVVGLTLAELLLAGGGLLVIVSRGPAPAAAPSMAFVLAYAAILVGLALLPRIYVEFRRHASQLTLADTAMLVGLFGLGPLAFVVVAMGVEVVGALRKRQPALKTLFNLAHLLGGLVAAAATFTAFGRYAPSDPAAWLAAAAAIGACAIWDLLSTAVVLSIVEGKDVRRLVADLAPAGLVNVVVSSMLGVAAVLLWVQTPFGPLLFAPVVAVLLVSTRGVSHQRAERLRLQQLYEASSGLAPLVGLDDMLALIAAKGRELVTGAVAVCATARDDGTWEAVLVDDGRTRAAPTELVAALLALVPDGQQGTVAAQSLTRSQRTGLPSFTSLVWAAQQSEPAGRTLLVVFRELPLDGQDHHLADILAAFVTHAATAVANVGLHADVREALSHEVALNRHKSEFLAAVSHELRTPLAAMIGSIQTIRRQGERLTDDHREQLIGMSLTQGERLKILIEDLLLVAAADHKKVDVARDRVPVAKLLAELQQELAPIVGERLTVAAGDRAMDVVGDGEKIRRILINLIENGRKYAPSGPLEVTASRRVDTVSISVSDHGPGIDGGDRERVFERFIQLEQSSTRRQGGTGLGLYLCRELATLLGGTLTLTEAPSGGACFTLTLPAAHGHGAEPRLGVGRLPAGMARSPFARSRASAAARPRDDDPSSRFIPVVREGVGHG